MLSGLVLLRPIFEKRFYSTVKFKSDEESRNLMEWAVQKGYIFNKIKLASVEIDGFAAGRGTFRTDFGAKYLGFVATKDIKKRDRLLEFPRSNAISRFSIMSSPIFTQGTFLRQKSN